MILHEIPECHRSVRDGLRRAAVLAGYGVVHSGLLVAPTDRRQELDFDTGHLPDGCTVVCGELRLGTTDASSLAARAWPLEHLAARYRHLALELRSVAVAAARQPPSGQDALLRFAAAARPFYEATRDDPGLPEELLPADWPGAQLREAYAAVAQAMAGPLDAFLGSISESHPPPLVVEP